ncbi:hypothetical protein C8J57DRAFT_1078283, partial [Mycena rebaudengoi]
IPHAVSVEDTYRGFRIPADIIILLQLMVEAQVAYPNPHKLSPDRFLLNGRLNPAIRDPSLVFGFGRRGSADCVGRDLACESPLRISQL